MAACHVRMPNSRAVSHLSERRGVVVAVPWYNLPARQFSQAPISENQDSFNSVLLSATGSDSVARFISPSHRIITRRAEASRRGLAIVRHLWGVLSIAGSRNLGPRPTDLQQRRSPAGVDPTVRPCFPSTWGSPWSGRGAWPLGDLSRR